MTARRFLAVVLLSAFALSTATLGSAQEERKVPVVSPEGPEFFARLLDHEGLRPIESPDDLGKIAPFDKTIVIVFGDMAPARELEGTPRSLGRIILGGGLVLIATDREFDLAELRSLGLRSVRINGLELVNAVHNFGGQIDCPLVDPSDFVRKEHPLFENVKQPIATNCPSSLLIDEPALKTLATLPPDTVPRGFHQLNLPLADEARKIRRRFIAAAPNFLLFAGHGLFQNGLLARNDLDNRRLAWNAIRFLKDGRRTHVLFLHEMASVKSFQMPLTGVPSPPMPTPEAINRLIDAIQKDGLLQRLIEENIGSERIVRAFLQIATLLLLLYGLKKFVQSRYRLHATPPVVGATPPSPPNLVQQQMREMATRQAFGEPARALARDWFHTYAGLDFSPGRPLPDLTFEIRAGIANRRKIAGHIESLWKLASEDVAPNWDAKRLRTLAGFLEELTMSVVAGDVVFQRM